MLQLDTQNLSVQRVGEAHGLDIPAVLQQYADPMAEAVCQLYSSRNEEGAWTKWLNLGDAEPLAAELEAYAKQAKGRYDDVVILGIGGSSLGGLALLKALLHPHWNSLTAEQRKGYPRFHFVDNVDADVIRSLLDVLDLKRTLVNVISKSGTTAETMAAFLFIKARLDEVLGSREALRHHLVFTTDKQKGILRDLALQLEVPSFEVPDDVGGRFSVFSAVGMLPAALCGLDVREFQRGIRDMETLLSNPNILNNPAAQSALFQVLLYQKGKPISVFMPYSTRLAAVADWYVQLWAESLGKAEDRQGKVVHVGPTPVKAVGATDQHSQIQLYNEGPNDKIVTFIQVLQPQQDATIDNSLPEASELTYLAGKSFHQLLTAEFEATRASLTRNQRPNLTLAVPEITPYYFAQLLYFFEVQTGLAGHLLGIDPFNQPGVELAKTYTYALMGRQGYEHLIDQARGAVASSPSLATGVAAGGAV